MPYRVLWAGFAGWARGEAETVHGDEARRVLRAAMLPMYTRRDIHGLVGVPEELFYKVYRKGDEYAVLFVYKWPLQYIPPHMFDFEPVIVILDGNLKVKEVYADATHYYVHGSRAPEGYAGKPYLLVDTPWRSMKVVWGKPEGDLVMIHPYDEASERKAQTRMRYLSEHLVRELRSLPENPFSVHEKILRNPFAVRRAKHWTYLREPSPLQVLWDLARTYGAGNPFLLVGNFKPLADLLVEKIRRFVVDLLASRLRGTLVSANLPMDAYAYA